MFLVKILKRKDASSVIVAILLAMVIQQPLFMLTSKPANIISGVKGNSPYFYGPGGNWHSQYLYPIVWVIVEIVVLEVMAWIIVLGGQPFRRKRVAHAPTV